MSLPARRAKRRDANELEIVRALERAGAQVYRIDKPADLLVGFRQRWHLFEVKDDEKAPSKRHLTQDEAIVAAECEWMGLPYRIVASVSEALEAIGVVRTGH